MKNREEKDQMRQQRNGKGFNNTWRGGGRVRRKREAIVEMAKSEW